MPKQPLKKKTEFSIKSFKNNVLNINKTADKEMEWIVMPKAYQDATRLVGIPQCRATMVRGWSDTGKSTIKNLAIAAAIKQGILPVIFETEGNFDFSYAKDCGVEMEPVYGNDPETGEYGIIDWEGDFILFTPTKICEYCGKMDYGTGKMGTKQRKVAVVEDIGYIISDLLDKQDDGELPMPLFFIWDSVGSIVSWQSYSSKSGNNMFDAGAIERTFKPIFPRISASKEIGAPYNNTMLFINKIWTDSQNSVGGAVAIKNKGGEAFQYGIRLGIHVGGVAKAGTKKLKATLKGQEYQYGTVTKISVFKNQLPTPYNVTYSGTMCCVHNGIISEDEIDTYKKKEIPAIMERIARNETITENFTDDDINNIKFTEVGKLDNTPLEIEN